MKVVCTQRASNRSAANQVVRRLGDRFGAEYIMRTEPCPEDAELLIQWGFKPTTALVTAIQEHIPYVILDMGYWEGLRDVRQSVSINGLHGLSMKMPDVLDMPPRFHPPIKQWTEDGDSTLIIGQLAGDAALRGENPETWMRKQAADAVDTWGLKAKLRPHPRMLNPWEPPNEPLEDALDDAYICVTHTSTVGVTALLHGVRTIATHPGSPVYGSMAKGMRLPGRTGFFHELSHRDYDLMLDEEVDAAWAYITHGLPKARLQATLEISEKPGARL